VFNYLIKLQVISRVVCKNPPHCLQKLNTLIKSKDAEAELIAVSSMFGFLPAKITQLESENLSLNDSLKILFQIEEKLLSIVGTKAKQIQTKFSSVIEKNPGNKFLHNL
jgi:hypothetical protein